MASFRKRNDKWQARVRRRGYPDITMSFISKSEASAWAREVETALDKGTFVHRTETHNTTLEECLTRYLAEITPHKKHNSVEGYRIKRWLKTPLARRFIGSLKSSDFATWRDKRLKEGAAPNTIKLELAVISHLFFIARSEWGFEGLENPIKYIRKPKASRGRIRRASKEELKLLSENTDSIELPFIIQLAVQTGMRRGEIASINWQDIDLDRRVIQLWDTKNGDDRLVPLSSRVITLLERIPKRLDGRLFGMTPNAITRAFMRSCERSGLENLHFHDLRHEAITSFFEKGLSLPEVATISGHKTWEMLRRYTHLSAERIASKLD